MAIEPMDDVLQINKAKTEFREAYNSCDVDRLLSVFDDQGFTNMSEEQASFYGVAARKALRSDAEALFAEYAVHVSVIINRIALMGSTAYDYGWHEFVLTPRTGGVTVLKRQRYFELWTKSPQCQWKITLYMNNRDVREVLNGSSSRWFMSEESVQGPIL